MAKRRGHKKSRKVASRRKGRSSRRRRGNVAHLRKFPMAKCAICGRVIFGGPKGMKAHRRKKHRR